jgi:hypothetical protein
VLNVKRAWKSIQAHPMVLLGDIGLGKLVSDLLEIVLISMQESCTVCVECTTGMEIFLGTPDGTSR